MGEPANQIDVSNRCSFHLVGEVLSSYAEGEKIRIWLDMPE
jgi:hypothetical protein